MARELLYFLIVWAMSWSRYAEGRSCRLQLYRVAHFVPKESEFRTGPENVNKGTFLWSQLYHREETSGKIL